MPRNGRSRQITYKTAAQAWPRGPRLIILSSVDTEIAKFPLAFLESCGDNTWSYVFYVVSLLVEAAPMHKGAIVNLDGRPVNLHSEPIAGRFGISRKMSLSVVTSVQSYDPASFRPDE